LRCASHERANGAEHEDAGGDEPARGERADVRHSEPKQAARDLVHPTGGATSVPVDAVRAASRIESLRLGIRGNEAGGMRGRGQRIHLALTRACRGEQAIW
jgi:hypothetical protein